MTVRPKQFVAACNFSCAGHRFRAGDVVPASVALSAAMRFGDRFVTVERSRPRSTPLPIPAAITTPTPDGDVDNTQES